MAEPQVYHSSHPPTTGSIVAKRYSQASCKYESAALGGDLQAGAACPTRPGDGG